MPRISAPSDCEALSIDGTKIAYTVKGIGQTVLLVMGLGADGSAWDLHLRSFEKSFRCLIVDNRGTGKSDSPAGPYSIELMADDCAAVIVKAGGGPVVVIGISMGGAIAQQIAIRHPDLVKSLIISSSWAEKTPLIEDLFEELATIRPKLSQEEFIRRLQLLIWSPTGYSKNAKKIREDRAIPQSHVVTNEAFSAQCEACIKYDALLQLSLINVPTLITVGELDIFTPISGSYVLLKYISNSRIEIFQGSGHAHHWEDLEKYNQICEEFIRAS
jgi:pimeloyl-ACP methyl ester carboxylesterase